MINQIKLALTVLKYAYGRKMGIIFSLVTITLGIASFIFIPKSWFGGYFFIAAAMWPGQMLYSLGASNMFMASPSARQLQSSVPAALSMITYIPMYLCTALIQLFLNHSGVLTSSEALSQIILCSTFTLLIMLYMSVALKFYIAGTIVFIVTVVGLVINEFYIKSQILFLTDSLAAAILIGLFLIILGSMLQYIIGRLIYRFPPSRLAQTSGLRKNLV